jgi:membrane protease YdiL (CAAX protease family)
MAADEEMDDDEVAHLGGQVPGSQLPCPECDALNPAAAAFCGECGVRIGRRASSGGDGGARRPARGQRGGDAAERSRQRQEFGRIKNIVLTVRSVYVANAVFAAVLVPLWHVARARFGDGVFDVYVLAQALLVYGQLALLEDGVVLRGDDPTPAVWLAAVVLAPLGEEWLCRGVAWSAARRLAPPATTNLVTAIVFAFLHGLAGYLLAVPHRLVAGLVFGWLRLRSRSLLPGVLAHALHNLVAVAWFGG